MTREMIDFINGVFGLALVAVFMIVVISTGIFFGLYLVRALGI